MNETPALGAICHIEIPAPDLDAALAFYTQVFNWETRRIPGMDRYVLFNDTSGNLGGGFDPDLKPSDGGANIVISVPEVDAALKQIVEAGGQQVKERTAIADGEMGYYALFLDPNGNRLGVWSRQ